MASQQLYPAVEAAAAAAGSADPAAVPLLDAEGQGALVSPFDARDHKVEAIYPVVGSTETLPPTLDHRPKLRPVRDQGSTSTCAAQVAACIKEFHERIDTDNAMDFSAQFVYDRRANHPGDGMHGRDVMNILLKAGDAPESLHPFRGDPRPAAADKAKLYTIKEYAQVDTVEGVKRALFRDGPCYVSFPVYNHGTKMWKARDGETMTGGHAMTIVGYTRTGFIIRNSWGADWGDKGHCEYPFAEFGAHWEIWTTVDREGSPVWHQPRRCRKWCTLL